MANGFKLVAEYFDEESGETISSEELWRETITKPKTLDELGLLHAEQIQLLQSIQDFKLRYESELINEDVMCQKCGSKPSSVGKRKSKFHAALTDHEVSVKRLRCKCGWNCPDTVESIYGLSLHPDLVEKHAIQGTENSYRQASRHLNAESKCERSINNDDRIRRNVAMVGHTLADEHLKDVKALPVNQAANQLVAVIDGGHLKSKEKDTRSFEAMITTVFRPENIHTVDKHHNEIIKKSSAASALSDKQVTIKKLILNACRREGINARKTELTCLTDGASNCWSISNSLKTSCRKLINVLDWFHITKRFTVINNIIDKQLQEKLAKVKWFLWHGNPNSALQRLSEIQSEVQNENVCGSLNELFDYLERNQKYITNYQQRKDNSLPYTSSYAECSVNEIVNVRQKHNKKMQWTREGAHNVLQIRAAKFSKTWDESWGKVKAKIFVEAA